MPGDPAASYLMGQIEPVDGAAEMPKNPPPLASAEIETIRRWIAAGAHDDSPAAPLAFSRDNPPVYTRLPAITSVDATSAGNLLAVAGFHEVILLEASTGAPVGRLVGMSERIESVRFSPDGTRLAAAGGEPGRSGEIQIWNVASQELEVSKSFTYDTLRGVSWSPDGSLVAFGGTDNVVRAIDAVSGEQKVFQGAHEDWVLGTAFIADGTHIVSVARDMTCKLTETATERFIDNITSITPGALRGGLSAVVPLPGRDEILVGGADGSAKVYRVFRATPRKIGDDANLLRTLPGMPGRIFAVDISDDTKVLAAVSTIDGVSELCLWKAREQAEVPDDIMAILKKEAGQRSDEEKKQLTTFTNPAEEELARVPLPVAVYAACFLPSNEVAVGGADGMVRVFDQAGTEIRSFPVGSGAGCGGRRGGDLRPSGLAAAIGRKRGCGRARGRGASAGSGCSDRRVARGERRSQWSLRLRPAAGGGPHGRWLAGRCHASGEVCRQRQPRRKSARACCGRWPMGRGA